MTKGQLEHTEKEQGSWGCLPGSELAFSPVPFSELIKRLDLSIHIDFGWTTLIFALESLFCHFSPWSMLTFGI